MTDFNYILKSCGENAVVTDSSGSHQIKVIVTPETQNHGKSSGFNVTEMGVEDTARFLCFLPGNFEFEGCRTSWLSFGGQQYDFINASFFKVQGKASHWECVIKKTEEPYIDGN